MQELDNYNQRVITYKSNYLLSFALCIIKVLMFLSCCAVVVIIHWSKCSQLDPRFSVYVSVIPSLLLLFLHSFIVPNQIKVHAVQGEAHGLVLLETYLFIDLILHMKIDGSVYICF